MLHENYRIVPHDAVHNIMVPRVRNQHNGINKGDDPKIFISPKNDKELVYIGTSAVHLIKITCLSRHNYSDILTEVYCCSKSLSSLPM